MSAKPKSPERWWSSLFFKWLLGIISIFLVGTFFVFIFGGLGERRAMRRAIDPAVLEASLKSGLEKIGIADLESRMASPYCSDLLRTMIPQILEGNRPVWFRYNRSVIFDGQVTAILRYRQSDFSCQYPAEDEGILSGLMRETEAQALGGRPARLWRDMSDGGDWFSVVSLPVEDQPGLVVSLGLRLDGATLTAMFPELRALTRLGFHLLVISLLSAIVLAGYVSRRIRRGERAAAAWTRGELSVRINEKQGDEFGRLSRTFDHMADSLEKMMEVRQSLAAAEERSRLVLDLHDNAKQRCFALGLRLSVLSHELNRAGPSDKIDELLHSAIELTTLLQNDLTDVIKRFSRPTIASDGLLRALSDSLDLLLAGSGINLAVNIDPSEARYLETAPQWAEQLLLLTNEAAANVLRHSGADQLELSFRREDGQGVWSVTDNGRGFSPEAASGQGMGLTSLKHRAGSLPGGRLSFGGGEGRGTAVTVIFDLW